MAIERRGFAYNRENSHSAAVKLNSMLKKFQEALRFLKRIHEPQESSIKIWNTINVSSCLVALLLDPLFFYIPIINGDKQCYTHDRKLKIVALVLRSVTDIFYLFHIALQFRIDRKYSQMPDPDSIKDSCQIAKRYMRSRFLIDIFVVLPIPQMIVLYVIPKLRASTTIMNAKDLLIFVALLPNIPRGIRINSWYRQMTRTSGTRTETAWAEAAFNLFLYLLAGHVLGAVWYFFSIERQTACWQRACAESRECLNGSFYCNDNVHNDTYLDNSCSVEDANGTSFHFGIFADALQSGVVKNKYFLRKFIHCFRWGLQNLSAFGQNLNPSTYFWENCFVIFIIIIGLVLFLLLIGNLQTYLQYATIKAEEIRVRMRGLEIWMNRNNLPGELRVQIRNYERIKWHENTGFDMENLLQSVPKDLSIAIKRHLCLDLLKRVPIFKDMEEKLLDYTFTHLKPFFYVEGSVIARKGDKINSMFFIKDGVVLWRTTDTWNFLAEKREVYCGEELISWALGPEAFKFPDSEASVQAFTKVEGFLLTAEHLKVVLLDFKKQCKEQLPDAFKYYLGKERRWAVSIIEGAWGRCQSRRREREVSISIDKVANFQYTDKK